MALQFYMKAYNTVRGQFVYWVSINAPDMTGIFAPNGPANLAFISIIKIDHSQIITLKSGDPAFFPPNHNDPPNNTLLNLNNYDWLTSNPPYLSTILPGQPIGVTVVRGSSDGINLNPFASLVWIEQQQKWVFTMINPDGTIGSPLSISVGGINFTGTIDVNKLTSGSSGQILLNNATPIPAWTTISGDAVMSPTGVVTNTGLQGITVPVPSGSNTVLTFNAGAYSWATGGGGGFTAGGDLSGSSTNQTVIKINSASVPVAGSLTTGNVLQVSGASALTYAPVNLGGGANFVTGTLPTGNQASQSMGGDVSGTTGNTTVVKINGTSVPSSPSANQVLVATSSSAATWQQIADAQVSNSAAIAVSKLAAGSAAQVLLSNATPTPTWTPISGDAIISATGVVTVDALQGNTVRAGILGAAQDGYVLTWKNDDNRWEALPDTDSSIVTLSGDVTGSSNANTVVKIQNKSLDSSLSSLGSSQDGYVLTWVNGSSDWQAKPIPGDVDTLIGDVTGSLGANTVVAISGTTPIAITPAELRWTSGTASPKLDQASTSSTSGQTLTIQAQGATGSSHNGGDLALSSGNSGSATAGTINLQTGSTTRLSISPTNITVAAFSTAGVVHNDSSGNLSSSLIVNADVGSSAAIAYSKLNLSNSIVNADINSAAAIDYSKLNLTSSIVNADIAAAASIVVSKLAAGTSAQILLNNSTPTPTWTTVGGDATIGNTGTVTVTGIQGNTFTSGSPTKGQFVVATSTTNYGPVTLSGDVSESASTAGLLTVVGIQSNTVTSGALTKGQFFVATSTSNWAATTLSGDLSESAVTSGLVTVTGIQGNTFTSGSPVKGQFVVATSTSNYGPATISGDISESSSTAALLTVTGIQGNTITSGALVKGQFFVATSTSNWAATSLSGDLSESATTAGQVTVVNINGASVPAAGSLTTGNVLQVNGSSSLTYAPVNLGGGANFVTGTLPTGNQAAQSLTLTGDVTSSGGTTASASTTVAAISGSTPIVITPAELQWKNTTSSPIIDQASESTVTKGQDLTIAPQQSTHTTDQGGGNLLINLQTPTGTGVEAYVNIQRGGTTGIALGNFPGGQAYQGIWLGTTAVTTKSTQYTIVSSNDASDVRMNTTSGGTIGLYFGAAGYDLITTASFSVGQPTLQWLNNVSSPTFNQAAISSASGQTLTIQAQGATGTSHNGGNLILASGTSGSATAGNLQLQIGSTTELTLTDAQLQWASGITTPTVNQATPASSSGAGTAATNMAVTAQVGGATTGTSQTAGAGGGITVSGGAGGDASGGTNSTGGAGGNVTLTPGAGGAKSGSGTAGAAGTIILNGSQRVAVSSLKTSTYSIVKGDYIIGIGTLSGAITVNLPSSPSTGDVYIIKDVNGTCSTTNAVTITPASGNIDGQASFVMVVPYDAIMCVYMGTTGWAVI